MHNVSFDIIWKSVPYSSMNRRLNTLKGVVVLYVEGIVLVAFWSMNSSFETTKDFKFNFLDNFKMLKSIRQQFK